MRHLLDTHALLWLFSENAALSARAFEAIADPDSEILVSAATACEIAIKARRGKLPGGMELLQDFAGYLSTTGFVELPLCAADAIRAGLLPEHHKDPFDRILAAQCQAESIPIISNDKIFDLYGVRRIW